MAEGPVNSLRTHRSTDPTDDKEDNRRQWEGNDLRIDDTPGETGEIIDPEDEAAEADSPGTFTVDKENPQKGRGKARDERRLRRRLRRSLPVKGRDVGRDECGTAETEEEDRRTRNTSFGEYKTEDKGDENAEDNADSRDDRRLRHRPASEDALFEEIPAQ